MENTSWTSLTIEINPCIPKSVPVEVMMDEKKIWFEKERWREIESVDLVRKGGKRRGKEGV